MYAIYAYIGVVPGSMGRQEYGSPMGPSLCARVRSPSAWAPAASPKSCLTAMRAADAQAMRSVDWPEKRAPNRIGTTGGMTGAL